MAGFMANSEKWLFRNGGDRAYEAVEVLQDLHYFVHIFSVFPFEHLCLSSSTFSVA